MTKRTIRFSFRISDTEAAQIQEKANRAGVERSAYIRNVLFAAPIPRKSRQPLAKKDLAILGRFTGILARLNDRIKDALPSEAQEIKDLLRQIHSSVMQLVEKTSDAD